MSTVNCLLLGLQMSMYSESKGELTHSSLFSATVRCHQGRTFILSVPVLFLSNLCGHTALVTSLLVCAAQLSNVGDCLRTFFVVGGQLVFSRYCAVCFQVLAIFFVASNESFLLDAHLSIAEALSLPVFQNVRISVRGFFFRSGICGTFFLCLLPE